MSLYMVRKHLSRIVEVEANGNSEPDAMAEALSEIESASSEALKALNDYERQQLEEPQEMRDLFAAAALMGLLNNMGEYHKVWKDALNLSDKMMAERRERIQARKGE